MEKLSQLAKSRSLESEDDQCEEEPMDGAGGVKNTQGSIINWEDSAVQTAPDGQIPRGLPPLSPRCPPSPRPPLPTPRKTTSKLESEDRLTIGGEDDLRTSASDEEEEVQENADVHLATPRKAKRDHSPSSILLELMDPNDENYEGSRANHTGQPLSPESRRSRKEEMMEQLSPRSQQSRTSGGKKPTNRLSRSSSSSQIMATLFGTNDEPKVIPENISSQDDTPRHSSKKANGPSVAPKSPRRHGQGSALVQFDSPGSSAEESNSIVTQTSTHTKDLLNGHSRRVKQMAQNLEHPLVKANIKKSRSPCDWFMPVEFEPPQSPPTEELPVAVRPNVYETSTCGVASILPTSCTSVLARRTWNYGKKQSRAASGQMTSNSEASSIVSVTTNPTATTATIPAGPRQQGGNASCDSSGAGASTISTKYNGSTILAKRDKLRRKQRQFVQSSSSSGSGSSQSEKQEIKSPKRSTSAGTPT